MTKSCCRQSLTIVCDKLQWSSVRAQRYYQLSWPTTAQLYHILSIHLSRAKLTTAQLYHTLSIHLARAKLITHFDDWYAVAKFRVWSKFLEGSALIFIANTWISLQHSAGLVEGSAHAKNQPSSFSCFHRTPTCDRHRHRAIASTHYSTASCG